MTIKNLYIFLEGADDERFFKSIIIPHFRESYDLISIYTYAKKSKVAVTAFIKTINDMDDNDYIFIADIDNQAEVDDKINLLTKTYNNLDKNKVFIVIKEIEAWYLAGVNDKYSQENKIKIGNNTNDINKEKFNHIIAKSKLNKIPRSNAMIDILKNYDVDLAKRNNKSLEFMLSKIIG